jgi:hypothetical protein
MQTSPLPRRTPAKYAAEREALLERIRAWLSADPRICAAWLAGSYGRGEQDAFSDLDLFAVVEEQHAPLLCGVRYASGAGSPPARLALFSIFGDPLNIHENHHNAPRGGTFSAVLYRDPPVIVDWVLVPRSLAARPEETRLLFDRAGVPVGYPAIVPEPLAKDAAPDLLAERMAFFWMMAAVTAKYIQREDRQKAGDLLDFCAQIEAEVSQLRGSRQEPLAPLVGSARTSQAACLRELCRRVYASAAAHLAVESILSLSEDDIGSGIG